MKKIDWWILVEYVLLNIKLAERFEKFCWAVTLGTAAYLIALHAGWL